MTKRLAYWRAATLLVLALLVLGSQVGSSFTSSGSVELGTPRAYELAEYGTFVFWNSTLHANAVEGYSDRVSFIDASLVSNSAFSFGLGARFANATITYVNATVVEIRTGPLAPHESSSSLYFYYSTSEGVPSSVDIVGKSSALVTNSDFSFNANSFRIAKAPAVFQNQSSISIKLDSPAVVSITTPFSSTRNLTSTSSSTPSFTITAITSKSTITTSNQSKPSNFWWMVASVAVAIVVVGAALFFLKTRRGRRLLAWLRQKRSASDPDSENRILHLAFRDLVKVLFKSGCANNSQTLFDSITLLWSGL